jgi:carbamoylphosphate synthase large subunit
MSKILVTGVGGPAGRSVTSLLLERRVSIVGTDMQSIDMDGIRFYQVPPADSPDLLAAVYEIASREKVDLLIPTVSEELPVYARGWRWQEEIPALISRAKAVETANDKYLTSRALLAHEVGVPRFCLPSQVHSPADLAERIGWPCISKPRIGRGGREVFLREQEDWPVITALGDHYILQEFAEGTDYAPNIHVGHGGQAVVVVLEKTELKEGKVGNAKSVRRVADADVAELAMKAARAVGLRGPLDIDIRRKSDGTPVVLEINARFGANIRHAPEVFEAALAGYLTRS